MSITLSVTTFASGNSDAMMNSRDRQRFNIQITSSTQLAYSEITLKIKFEVLNNLGNIDPNGTITNVGYKIRHKGRIHRTEFMPSNGANEITVFLSEYSDALGNLGNRLPVTLNLDLKTGIHYISQQENANLSPDERVVEFDTGTGEPYRTPAGTLCIKYWVDSVDIATQPTTPSEVTSIINVKD